MGQYFINPYSRERNHSGLFEANEYSLVNYFFSSLPKFEPTPLIHLRALASKLGVCDILLKNESVRLGLDSFKILGASYAVRRLLSEGRLVDDSVVVCASEGNHGRAIARVAAENKLRAKIYVASATSSMRIQKIESEGAEVIVVDGNYDDAVRQAAHEARQHGWHVISDTSWPEYEKIPRWIMLGYTKLMTEAEMQWLPDPPPDAILVQAGVGGLACAVVSWLCRTYGTKRPFVIVCEPASAACLLQSSRAGKPVALKGPFNTIMAGLRCGEMSPIAWPTLVTAVDAFVSIDDEQCTSAMRMLAYPASSDPAVVAGASGACGFATLLAILQDERLRPVREVSGVNVRSRILVINTEGATDLELYLQVIGINAGNNSSLEEAWHGHRGLKI
jgi:diaminopropionate ammonia-lyase